MSNYLAVASVTATLVNMLSAAVQQDAIGDGLTGATVTYDRPEKAGQNGDVAKMNVYLYQVVHNASWRNTDIVQQRPNPAGWPKSITQSQRQTPVNLHYLLSFYGNEALLLPQRLLGAAVVALDRQPWLRPEDIQRSIRTNTTHGTDWLYDTKLAAESYLDYQVEQIQRVTLSPLPLNLEEMSKLWSVFFQVPYTLSIAYEASVVLLSHYDTMRTAQPVLERHLYTRPDPAEPPSPEAPAVSDMTQFDPAEDPLLLPELPKAPTP